MVNKWVEHVRQFAKENGLSYGCALSTAECRESYQSSKAPKATKKATKTKVNPQVKAYGDLINIAEKSKQMKPRFEVPITFIKTNFKKRTS